MDIVKAFERALAQKEKMGWEKIYVLVDVHDTIMQGVHQSSEVYLWYKWALPALYLLSEDDGVCLILWTGSHEDRIREILGKLMGHGIVFDYVNSNPEAEDNEFYCGNAKPYFNVGIDDRFGFEPEKDWKDLYLFLDKLKIDRKLKGKDMENTELKEWVAKINSDSKKESATAKNMVIKGCTPILKEWYNAVRRYGDDDCNISEEGDYRDDRGEISDVSFRNGELCFRYTDGCLGEYIEDYIRVKADELLADGFAEKMGRRERTRAIWRLEEGLKKCRETEESITKRLDALRNEEKNERKGNK